MKIAYISHATLPSSHTNTEQMIRTLVEMVRQGIEVDFYLRKAPGAGLPEALHLDEISRFYGAPRELLREGGLRLIEIPSAVAGSKPLSEAAHELRAPWRAGKLPYDALYTRDGGALLTAALFGDKPVFFETYRTDYNTLRRWWPWRKLGYRSSRFAGVIAHSRFAADSFLRAGVPEARLLVAYNGYSPELLEPRLGRSEARGRLGWPEDRKIVVYTGNIQPGKGLGSVLDVAALIPDAIFAIVGAVPGSAEEKLLRADISARGLGNVWSVPRVPPPRVPEYLYAADCLIIPPTAKPLEEHGKTVLPMKTFVYLAAGRPILAPDLPDLAEVLADGKNARLVPPDLAPRTAAALQSLLENPVEAGALARQAELDSKLYTWRARAGRIQEFLSFRLQAIAKNS